MKNQYKDKLRFLIVGGSSTILDFIIYMLLSNKISIGVSKLISMLIASLYSFFLNKNWTFSNKDGITFFLVFKYIVGQALNIGINTLINLLIFNLCGYKIVAFICATLIAMIFNFIFQKNVVFKGVEK